MRFPNENTFIFILFLVQEDLSSTRSRDGYQSAQSKLECVHAQTHSMISNSTPMCGLMFVPGAPAPKTTPLGHKKTPTVAEVC